MLGRMHRSRELRASLFGQMMQRFGLQRSPDYAYPEGAALRVAAARCVHCTEVARCKLWLATTTGTEGAADFCPNAATFAALASRTRQEGITQTEMRR